MKKFIAGVAALSVGICANTANATESTHSLPSNATPLPNIIGSIPKSNPHILLGLPITSKPPVVVGLPARPPVVVGLPARPPIVMGIPAEPPGKPRVVIDLPAKPPVVVGLPATTPVVVGLPAIKK